MSSHSKLEYFQHFSTHFDIYHIYDIIKEFQVIKQIVWMDDDDFSRIVMARRASEKESEQFFNKIKGLP
jgi:hypothetical protein